jgi:methyltransferase of FxLD system
VIGRNHVIACAALSARSASVRLSDGHAAFGRLMAFGYVEDEVDHEADHQWSVGEELIEGAWRKDRHEHSFPVQARAYLAAEGNEHQMSGDSVLREALLAHLQRAGVLRSPPVVAAMRAVPRHRFVPDLPLEEAYADRAVPIKMRDDAIVSSISQPAMIAQMLELLAPRAGDRVLEIGTGSGYNAALLAEIVGSTGSVTTIEVDGDLAGRARATLEELGYSNVKVLVDDGTRRRGSASYDCVMVTARTDDIAAAWWETLREGTRIVVPLLLESAGEYAIGFVRRSDRLQSIGAHPCAFIELRTQTAKSPGSVFFHDPSARGVQACVRPIRDVVAMRLENATPQLLDDADIVIARPVTLFAVTLATS